MRNTIINLLAAGALLLTPALILVPTLAAAQGDMAYGRQLMTEQEWNEHRAKMQGLKTEQEREAYRLEHHKHMQARAKERGITLPDAPQPRGKGLGAGPRDGTGAGPNR